MVSVTGTDMELAAEVIRTVPEYVPTASVPGVAETVMEPGVVPPAGLTASQVPPEAETV
jgi:hypothetical protein